MLWGSMTPQNKKHFSKLCVNAYLFLRERERERKRVSKSRAERERDTESEAGSRLRAVSAEPDTGLEPTNREIMT